MKAAAVQMNTLLADVKYNLKAAERLATEAAALGAEIIILPEFFNSGIAFDDAMLGVARYGSETRAFLIDFARRLNVALGGSFLELSGGEVYNTFLLALPNGEVYSHRKDIPTQFENCYYTFGDEEHILHTPIGDIGVALCWEMIRYDTVKRLAGRAGFIVAGSCWWDLPLEAPAESEPLRAYNQALAVETTVTFARILGVPLIHASHCSTFTAHSFPQADRLQTRRMVGAAQIIDAAGMVITRRTFQEGEGVVFADITPQKQTRVKIDTGEHYWIPALPETYLKAWQRNNELGREYYQTISLPYYKNIN